METKIFNLKFKWLLVPLVLISLGIGSAWGAEGDELYNSGAFNTGSNVSYTMNGTLTKASRTWTISTYQINSSVFYLGCNSNNASKGILAGTQSSNPNNAGTWNDVVTALKSASSWYNTYYTTAHAYAMSMSSTYNKVGNIKISWSGAAGPGIAYLFADTGSGLTLLATSNVSNGQDASGNLEYSNTTAGGINISRVVFVYRGGSDSTPTSGSINKTIRITSIVIKEGKSAPSGTSVSLTKAASSNGSFTLSDDGPLNTASAQTITVTGTPNTGYYLSGVTQSGASSTPTITKTSATTYTIQYPASCTGTSTITATFSPIWQLRGDFNSWGTTDPLTTYSAGVATVTKTLDAMTKYEFKMYNAQETAYYKNIGKIITDISGYDYTSGDGANTFLYTGPAGTYTFKFTLEGKLLQVQYPEVSHPADGYAYFQQQGSWTGFKAYIYTSDDNRMSDWAGSPNVTNTTNICGTTYYYCALTTDFNNVIFRDNSLNQWKAITTTGYSGKYCGDDYDAATQTWKTFGTYSLTFAGNGNTSGSMTDLAGQCPNSNIVLAANAFAKTDHTFTGWIANVNVKNSSGTTITAGTLITDESTIQITQNTILTAQWTHNPELTVSKSSIAFGSKKVDGSYTETFTVSGSYLKGNIGIAVSGTNNAMFTVSSSTLTPSDGSVATTTITVTYSPTTAASHSATITISSTGATSKTITLSGTGQYQDTYIDNIWNQSVAVQTGSYTRPSISDQDDNDQTDCQHLHYHFVGWITKAKYDAGTAIAAGDLQATGSVTASNATFYAVWAKEDAGGGSSTDYELVTSSSTALADGDQIIIATSGEAGEATAMGNQATNNRPVRDVTISAGPVISNPTFASSADNTTDIFPFELEADGDYFRIIDKVNEDYLAALGGTNNNYLKLYGNSSNTGARQFTISVDEDGVATIKANIEGDKKRDWMRYNADNNPPIISCYNSGQAAVYIYRKPGVSYTDYIASCGAEYDITLDKNGGTANGSAVVTANATALNSGFTAPVYAGHQVDYYMVAADAGSTKIAEADGTLAASVTVDATAWTDANGKWVKGGDATFCAKWKDTECVITLNNEGATSAGTTSVTATYGASTNLTTDITTPTKNGYNFGGYYTAAGGSGTQLINADGSWIASVSGYTNDSKQWQLDQTALELHAEWTLKSYTVTWVVNGETEATQTNVNYGTRYDALTQEPDVDDDALSDCGSDKFVGWVTQEYTGENGTAATNYEPYKVSDAMLVDDTHHTFYAMFAKEEGTAFTLEGDNGSTQECAIYYDNGTTKYYATGAIGSVNNGKIATTTNSANANVYVFTKTGSGTYTIQLKDNTAYYNYSSSTDLGTQNDAYTWTITDVSSAGLGSWRLQSGTSGRAWICATSGTPKFGGYSTSNVVSNQSYRDVELGSSNLTNYRTGCCDEKITLAVSDATSGAGGTVALQWNNADKSAGDQVSTCSAGTLVAKVTANPDYILTAMAISGTNKSITTTPADLATGLPSTGEMTYSVAVQALATGTLTITPTFSRTYTVTYDLVGGETSGSIATVRYQSGEQVTLVTPDPTKSGYNFSGWTVTKENGGNVTVSSGKFTMPADNVTATATWAEKTLTSINLGSASVEVYVGQYVEIPVTYDPADILTKNYTLVSTPAYCVTTGSTITTLKITGGRGGVTITENKTETVSIKANADDSKTASVSVTVKPLPVDHYVDLIHGETFEDKGSTIVNNALSATYTAPGYTGDYSGSTTGDCETNHLHLVGWIDSEWADAHPKASHAEIIAAEGYHTAREAGMTASNKTYYAVWGDEQ